MQSSAANISLPAALSSSNMYIFNIHLRLGLYKVLNLLVLHLQLAVNGHPPLT